MRRRGRFHAARQSALDACTLPVARNTQESLMLLTNAANTSRERCKSSLGALGWHRIPEPDPHTLAEACA